MSLAAMAARRLVLRRGFSALLGVALTSGAGASGRSEYPSPPLSGRFAGRADDAEDTQKQLAAKPYNDKLRAARKRAMRRREAWHEQDMDLVVLGSTSRAWRAAVMTDRIRERDTFAERLEERVSAIWDAPMDKLAALVRGWVDG